MPSQETTVEPSDASFASALKQRRSAMRLTLDELARRVGCARSYLSAIEHAHRGPPSDELIEKLEEALSCQQGELREHAAWDRTPTEIRRDLEKLRSRDLEVRTLLKRIAGEEQGARSLDELFRSGALRRLVDEQDGTKPIGMDAVLPLEVPLINRVSAGYPAGFTDLDYPARVADEYIRAPDIQDADAFAARVVGDSMEPDYREGDIVVFSPATEVRSGTDCFVRFEANDESTFKRVYFETDQHGAELIRIQPINNAYPPRTVPREAVAGLYAGVSVTRKITPQ